MNFWKLKRKIHVSWLITVAGVGVLIGVFIAQYMHFWYFSTWACLVVSFLLILVAVLRRYVYLIPIIAVGGVLFGLWRGSISQNELTVMKPLYGQQVIISGVVQDDVDMGVSDQIIIRLGNIMIGGTKLPGVLWISSSGKDIKRGDKLVITGKLTSGFGNFSGVMYRANVDKIIHPIPGDIARVVRDWFADAVRKVIVEPEASLGIGYLVGQRRALPADLVTALKVVGLTHVVVASGYNLTILVRLSRRLFIKLSKYLATLSAVIMILAFISITGASPSMMRAGIVAGLSLAAWYYGRKFHPITLLVIAMDITIMINPSYAWGDLGWQLSFLAFAGVMILAPLLHRYFFGDGKPGIFRQILGETISAQIVTAPIIIISFGQISNVAILSNLLVLPLVPLTMLLAFVAGIGSLVLPLWIATVIAWPAYFVLSYMVSIVKYLGGLNWAVSELAITWWVAVFFYGLIVCGCLYMWRKTKLDLREVNLVE